MEIFLMVGLLLVFAAMIVMVMRIKSARRKHALLEAEQARRLAKLAASVGADISQDQGSGTLGMRERRSDVRRRSGKERREKLRLADDRRHSPGRRKEDRVWSGKNYPDE